VNVPIHPDFGLLGTATITSNSTMKISRTLPSWLLLGCEPPTNLEEIVEQAIPHILAAPIVQTYKLLVKSVKSPFAIACERKFGLHDLFRLISRVKAKIPGLMISDSTTFVTEFQKTAIGYEFVDIFASHSPSAERQSELTGLIECGLDCGPLTGDSAPAFSATEATISVGEISLNRRIPLTSDNSQNSSFTMTCVHLRMMQSIVKALSAGESVLCVGDTGTGKTTTVQFLARELGVKMHVYNFSDQTEGSDLVGGLKPVIEVEKMVADCEHLLKTTMPVES
jgi:midasin